MFKGRKERQEWQSKGYWTQKHSWFSFLYGKNINIWNWKSWVKVTQSCATLCDLMDYTVHGFLQARILEWVAVPFSKASSQPRDWAQVSCIAGRFFFNWAIREAHKSLHQIWKKHWHIFNRNWQLTSANSVYCAFNSCSLLFWMLK